MQINIIKVKNHPVKIEKSDVIIQINTHKHNSDQDTH